MRNRLIVFLWVCLFGVWAAAAQDDAAPPSEPIAQVEAGDFRALAITGDGQWLMVADAAANQMRVYNLNEAGQPLVVTAPLDGVPIDIATGGDFALVAVDTGGRSGLAQIIAPTPYDRRQPFAPITWIDLPDRARGVSLSSDARWGAVIGTGGWMLLEILSSEEVNTTFYATPVNDVAFVRSTALIATRNTPMISRAELDPGAQATLTRVGLELPALATHLTVNVSSRLGAAALENGTLVLFDPVALEIISTMRAVPASDLHFLSFEDGEWLVVMSEDRTRVRLFDVTDPANVGDLGDLPLVNTPIQAITTFDDLIFTTDRSTVRIWQATSGGVQEDG